MRQLKNTCAPTPTITVKRTESGEEIHMNSNTETHTVVRGFTPEGSVHTDSCQLYVSIFFTQISKDRDV